MMREAFEYPSQGDESPAGDLDLNFEQDGQEVIERVPIDWGATRSYIEALFKGGPTNKKDLDALTHSLIEMFPGDIEAITALSELPSYFSAQRALDRMREEDRVGTRYAPEEIRFRKKKRQDLLIRLTQYQFLLTDLVTKNQHERPYLGGFWETAEFLAECEHSGDDMARTRESVLAQASIFQLFEQLGKHPSLSRPKEDAFNAIDLWIEESDSDEKQAIQVKGAPQRERFEVVPATQHISFPGILINEKKHKHYNAYIAKERDLLRAKLGDYAKTTKQNIEGYLVVIPRNRRDSVTGVPDSALIEEARNLFTA